MPLNEISYWQYYCVRQIDFKDSRIIGVSNKIRKTILLPNGLYVRIIISPKNGDISTFMPVAKLDELDE